MLQGENESNWKTGFLTDPTEADMVAVIYPTQAYWGEQRRQSHKVFLLAQSYNLRKGKARQGNAISCKTSSKYWLEQVGLMELGVVKGQVITDVLLEV